ncbi:MAG TPA: glycosyltransferase [Anaerolineae bacterium]|nr:glycosyltransferase [Anaerolineae bacterium]
MVNVSVIIPTRNRSQWLSLTIESLVTQDFSPSTYEILIVDNGSTDNTEQVVQKFISEHPPHNIKYIYEPEPGSLSARHRGALEANGEILVFTDDDVEPVRGWLSAIFQTFKDGSVHLVGGPNLPKFEVEPPEWIFKYWDKHNDGFTCGSLSLSSFGDKKQVIDPMYVWSLNWSIRKKTFFEAGGFHPCVIPKHLQQFQGDGETGLSLKLKEKGLLAVYVPEALIYHHISRERLTARYFEGRFYYQGVCDSYTQVRRNKGLENINVPERIQLDTSKIDNLPAYEQYRQSIYYRIHNAYIDGFEFHQGAVRKNAKVLDWVLKDNYFDYKLPKLEDDQTNPEADTRENECFISSDYEPALIRHQQAIEKNPNNVAAWAGVGQIAQRLNDRKTADAAFRRIYMLNPHHPELVNWIFPQTLRQTFDAQVSTYLSQDGGDYFFAPEEYYKPHKRLLDHYQVFAHEISLDTPGRNFLEIGAGAGGVSYIAKKLGFEVIATDIGITDNQYNLQAESGPAARRVLEIDVVEFTVSPQNKISQVINFSNGQKADYIFMRGVQFNRKHIGVVRYTDPARRDQGWLTNSQWYTATEWLSVLVDIFDNLNVGGRFISLGIYKLDQSLAQEVANELRKALPNHAELKITIHPHPQWDTITDIWLTKRRR